MKHTFWEISQRLIKEDAPSPMPSGGGAPPMGGPDMGMGGSPPIGGGPPMGGAPPIGGGMGGPPMGGPDMGMGGAPMGGPSQGGGVQKSIELKATDVWSVINKILDNKPLSKGKSSEQSMTNPLQSTESGS